jgi:hypothetical protein
MRISNFLLWQSAYAEFYSLKTYWPDFDIPHIDECLKAYAQRVRRFGAIPEAESSGPVNGNGLHATQPGIPKSVAAKNGHTTSVNGHRT